MADLCRTPSLQHAIWLIKSNVEDTVLEMRKLDAARITISLNPARHALKLLMQGHDVEWVAKQFSLLSYKKNIQPNTDVVRAFAPYAAEKSVEWFREFRPASYRIGRGVFIPVRPSGYWSEGGRLHVLWAQCWKGRTLDPLQLAILNTILLDSVLVDDFRGAQFEWLDLREVTPKKGRERHVIYGDQIGTVSEAELKFYLDILLTAFEQFSAEKTARSAAERAEKRKSIGPSELPLFR
ncbi:hypothetical protein [Ancylobacter oerskovii]|uniref:Uncharacterized protein n=1 Tax=Ancylobacter oerskovii TaxID=459519 RepID=A0ABW4YTQ5_9HYPH|nr:hypothetical protein [Ancylobacter oerskovii]MBS7543757.1 hypothetical protein [Ancylobacter oerskovii]